MAERGLDGVGDAALGEWREYHKAFHIRRRLSAEECGDVLKMIDMRDTPEGLQRMHKLVRRHPHLRDIALLEWGDKL